MISEVEPVDDVEDEKEEGHGDEEESVNVNVVLAADPLVPGQLHLAQSCVVQPVYDLAHALQRQNCQILEVNLISFKYNNPNATCKRVVVVAQLAKWLLLKTEVRSSNTIMGKF